MARTSLPNSLNSLVFLSRLERARDKTISSTTRQQAREHLAPFTTYTFPQYVMEPAHELICDALQAVVDGQLDRLMLFSPPQHGKSELVSRRLPPFFLAQHPDLSVVLASYSGDLAFSMGRDARNITESPEYQALFPEINVDPTSRAGDNWQIKDRRGFMKTAGFLGPLVGRGGELGIIDDPIANWRDAQSPTIRNNTFMWYKGTFLTRIRYKGAIIIVMTRWHEDDLAGRLLKEGPNDWHVIRLPAIAETQHERDVYAKKVSLPLGQPDPLDREPGEPMCPIRAPIDFLNRLKNSATGVGPVVWEAEFQGRPSAPEGNRIKRVWLERYVTMVPKNLPRIRYWDKAGTEGAGAFTAGVLLAHDPGSGITYVEDVVTGQWESGDREAEIMRVAFEDARRYRSKGAVRIYIEQEPGSGGKESAENTILKLTKAGFSVTRDPPVGNKDARLEPFAGAAQNGFIRLLRGEWNDSYISELAAVPFGTYRDQADATAGGYNNLVGDVGQDPQTQAHEMYKRTSTGAKQPRDRTSRRGKKRRGKR